MGILTPEIGLLVPLITALVGLATHLGLPKKFAPLVAVIIGIGLNFLGEYAPDVSRCA